MRWLLSITNPWLFFLVFLGIGVLASVLIFWVFPALYREDTKVTIIVPLSIGLALVVLTVLSLWINDPAVGNHVGRPMAGFIGVFVAVLLSGFIAHMVILSQMTISTQATVVFVKPSLLNVAPRKTANSLYYVTVSYSLDGQPHEATFLLTNIPKYPAVNLLKAGDTLFIKHHPHYLNLARIDGAYYLGQK